MTVGVGTEIAGYRILGMIGEGGMAIVYLAENVADGSHDVLKVLREELASGEDFRRRFLRESRYATALDHPNVVPVRAAGEWEGVLYILMRHIEGTDLHTMLQGGRLEPQVAMAILAQVAAALDAAHKIGLLHRDVKPGNVLVASGEATENGPHCYLTDFGLSKHLTQDSVGLTAAGDFVGTLSYTAPEQILGKQPGARADVYSLTCVLFECLAGEPPFTGESDVDVMYMHIDGDRPELTGRRSELPAAIDEVVAKGLAKDPGDRYASCGEMMEAAAGAVGVSPVSDDRKARTDAANRAEGQMSDKLTLKITKGNAAGTEVDVDDEFTFGRAEPGQGKLGDDVEISRRHAKVGRGPEGAFVVEDLGSTNGTILNGRQITGPESLTHGDSIEVGGTVLVVELKASSSGTQVSSTVPDAPPDQKTQAPVPPPEVPAEPDLPEERPDTAESEVAAAPSEAAAEDAVAPEAESPGPPPPPPPLALQLEVDFEAGEAHLDIDSTGAPVKLVHEDGHWRVAEDE